MSDQIPPPGAERDAEILLLLGETRPAFTEPPVVTIERDADGACSVSGVPPYSTDPAACDQLVEAVCSRIPFLEFRDRHVSGQWHAFFMEPGAAGVPSVSESRPDAASRAALLALRAGR